MKQNANLVMQTKGHPKIIVHYLGSQAILPRYASSLASGADLIANIDNPIELLGGQRLLIPTGITLEIPIGYEAQVRSRSGLALKHGVVCLNSPGTIDADYRGEVKVILANTSSDLFIIEPTMRIAQLVFAPVVQVEFIDTKDLGMTDRGEGGFGSSGLINR